MKIQFQKAIQIFRAFDELVGMYPDSHKAFSSYAKRFCAVHMKPEIDYYNTLDSEERQEALDAEIDLPVAKISASQLPDIPNEYIDVLEPIVEGELKERESLLKTKLSGVKDG